MDPTVASQKLRNYHLQPCPEEVVTLLWHYGALSPHQELWTASIAAYPVWGPSRMCAEAPPLHHDPQLHTNHTSCSTCSGSWTVSRDLYLLHKLRRAGAPSWAPQRSTIESILTSACNVDPAPWLFVCYHNNSVKSWAEEEPVALITLCNLVLVKKKLKKTLRRLSSLLLLVGKPEPLEESTQLSFWFGLFHFMAKSDFCQSHWCSGGDTMYFSILVFNLVVFFKQHWYLSWQLHFLKLILMTITF